MPHTLIQSKPFADCEGALALLLEKLPQIIAGELRVPDSGPLQGWLDAEDIKLWPLRINSSRNSKDIEIVVFAHPFPERVANIEERKQRILKRISEVLRPTGETLSLAVCITLAPMAYGEIVINPTL